MRRSQPQKTIGKPTLKSLALSNDTGGLLRRPGLFEVRGPESSSTPETSPTAPIIPSVLGLNQSLLISQPPQLNGLILDERSEGFPTNGQAINSPLATFTQGDYVRLQEPPRPSHQSDFSISFKASSPTLQSNRSIVAFANSGSPRPLLLIGTEGSGRLRFFWRSDDNVILLSLVSGLVFNNSEVHTVECIYTQSTNIFEFIIDGEVLFTRSLTATSLATPPADLNRFAVGATLRSSASGLFNGSVYDLKISIDGSTEIYYPFSEGSGSVIHDVSGNGNHGTVISNNLFDYWENTQDDFHWSLAQGFTSDGDVEVPALADGSADANGNPITNPAGPWHNGTKTNLQLSGSVWAFNETQINPNFVRNDNGSGFADRFLSYDEVLEGDELTSTEEYVTE